MVKTYNDFKGATQMSELISSPTKNIVTGNQPVTAGGDAKIFDYGSAVPSSSDIKPAPSILTPQDADNKR